MPAATIAKNIVSGKLRRHISFYRNTTMSLDKHHTQLRVDLSEPLGQTLYSYGFNDPEAGLVEGILRPGDIFIDGGAHIGLFTLIAAATVGSAGHVLACEPVPETRVRLRANLVLNQFHWVDVAEVALAATPGLANFYSFGPGSPLSSFAPATLDDSHHHSVTVTSLDELVRNFTSTVRLVKLDIEGAEVKALQGASTLLSTHPDLIIEVEPEHLARQGSTVGDLQEVLSATGYRGYEIAGTRTAVILHPSPTLWPKRGNPNLFLTCRHTYELPFDIRST